MRVLVEIGAGERPAVTVYNKVDMLDAEDRAFFLAAHPDAVLISARSGLGIDALEDRIAQEASHADRLMTALVPFSQGALAAQVRNQAEVLSESYEPEGYLITAKVPVRLAGKVAPYAIEDPPDEPSID